MLARAGKYDNCLFHRLVPEFMVTIFTPNGLKIIYLFLTRSKLVILLGQALAVNLIGAHHFAMNTTSRGRPNTIAEVL
jgi:hypothetical protein